MWAALLGTALAIALAGAGPLRRLALRIALRAAWKEHAPSLMVLKYLGWKRPRLDAFEDG
jgi:hypothetical protein